MEIRGFHCYTGGAFQPLLQNKAPLLCFHKRMLDGLDTKRRPQTCERLKSWQRIKTPNVSELQSNNLYDAPLFTDIVRAFLSIQECCSDY